MTQRQGRPTVQIASRKPSGIRNRRTGVPSADIYFLGMFLTVVALLATWSARSQSTPRTVFSPPRIDHPAGFGVPTTGDADADPIAAERRREALRLQRHKQLVADSDKLLKLTQELNDEIAAAAPGPLTQEQLDKLSRIEKLARSVKSQMIDNSDQPSQTPAVAGPPIYSKPNISPK